MSHVAATIIRSEHRSLSAVVHGLQYFAHRAREGRPMVDLKVLRALLYYIDVFPERFHHPKEDRYLFKKLRHRTREAEEIISRLENDHLRGNEKIRILMQAAIRLEHGGKAFFGEFATQVDQYAQGQRRHMGLEEDIVLQLAEQELTEEDWHEIDAAFAGNADPLIGIEAKSDYDDLFSTIVGLMPAPIGLVLSWHATLTGSTKSEYCK